MEAKLGEPSALSLVGQGSLHPSELAGWPEGISASLRAWCGTTLAMTELRLETQSYCLPTSAEGFKELPAAVGQAGDAGRAEGAVLASWRDSQQAFFLQDKQIQCYTLESAE